MDVISGPIKVKGQKLKRLESVPSERSLSTLARWRNRIYAADHGPRFLLDLGTVNE